MEEKITSTAAELFRNLARARTMVGGMRSLAAEVDERHASDTPAEELPQVISDGIVNRIAALEERTTIAGFLPVYMALTKEDVPAEVAESVMTDELLEEPQQMMFVYLAAMGRCYAFTMDDSGDNLVLYRNWRGFDAYRQQVTSETLFLMIEPLGFYIYNAVDDMFECVTLNADELEEVRNRANSAYSLANTANNTANTAKTNASTALTTANTAKSTASTASTNASSALTKANTAQTTANTAKTTADTAQTTATTANSAASTANTTAEKALAFAEDAYWNSIHILDRIDNIDTSLTIRGQMPSGLIAQSGTTYKFDGSASNILSLDADKTTGIFTGTVPSRPKSCFQMFMDNKKILRVETMPDLSQCTSLYMAFYLCENLMRVNTHGWDTSACTSMVYIFSSCKALEDIDVAALDTSNVLDIGGAFSNCHSLPRLDLSGWNMGKCRNFEYMFNGCRALEYLDVSTWDMSSATSLAGMFTSCDKLTSLDVSGWNTPSLTNVHHTFYQMFVLEELDLTGWDVSKVTNFRAMFMQCRLLHSLHLGVFDMGSANLSEEEGVRQMFWECNSLENITGEIRNLSRGLDMRHSPLTNESAMVIINGLVDIDHSETITFSPTTYDTLTEEQIALATSKGFTVVKSS